MLYEEILANKELLKIIYALVICFICAIIVLKTDRMFKLSDHQGLRYFRNAFFLYGLSFIVRFILGSQLIMEDYGSIYFTTINFFFEFFIIAAGFFLLYSLIWKHVEKEKSHHSFFNPRAGIFYVMAFILAYLDILLATSLFMYISQIILFFMMSIISYKNYSKNKKKYPFQIYYFMIIILGLVIWILNTALKYFLDWNKVVQMGVYGLNVLFFLFFLYAITKITSRK